MYYYYKISPSFKALVQDSDFYRSIVAVRLIYSKYFKKTTPRKSDNNKKPRK